MRSVLVLPNSKAVYELMQVDGWVDSVGNAGWNDCTVMGTFAASSHCLRRAFVRQLSRKGVLPRRGSYVFERYGEHGEHLEMQDRQSGVALFAAVNCG